LDKKGQKLIKQLEIGHEDMFLEKDQLISGKIIDRSKLLDFEKIEDQIRKVFESVELTGGDIDETLVFPVRGECQKAVNSISKLQKKFIRALRKKDEKTISRLIELKEKIFPNGVFQERLQNVLTFSAINHSELIDTIYDNSEPFNQDYKIIELDE
jgi:uncharacterized protein YllA (UPF0747 family)